MLNTRTVHGLKLIAHFAADPHYLPVTVAKLSRQLGCLFHIPNVWSESSTIKVSCRHTADRVGATCFRHAWMSCQPGTLLSALRTAKRKVKTNSQANFMQLRVA